MPTYTIDIPPYTAGQVPAGIDRADGVAGRPGTPSPDGSILTQSANGTLLTFQEYPDSPEFERAEQGTVTHRFHGSYADILAKMPFLSRGSIWVDSAGNIWKLLSAKMQAMAGGAANLTTVSESLSFDPPPDEFSCEPEQLGINILKHPRYFYALQGANDAEYAVNQSVIRRLQDYFENVSAAYRDAIISELKRSIGYAGTANAFLPPVLSPANKQTDSTTKTPGTDMAKSAAMEIVLKYWRNEETPYMVGWNLTWSRYYFAQQYFNPGGKIEDPFSQASPQVPDYFWTTPDGTNFLNLVGVFNPQCFSAGGLSSMTPAISWLRQADRTEYQRTFFKVTRSWKGTAVGHWDAQFFGANYRPQTPSDYQTADAYTPA